MTFTRSKYSGMFYDGDTQTIYHKDKPNWQSRLNDFYAHLKNAHIIPPSIQVTAEFYK